MAEYKERIQKVVVDHLGVDPDKVTTEATFDGLGADSLDKLELVMGIEEEFGLEIPDSIAAPWATVGDVEAYINAQIH